MRFLIFIISIILFNVTTGVAQNNTSKSSSFTLKGEVIESTTNQPVSKVNVEINGGGYTTTNREGLFFIEAKVGDELIIRSDTFETVYYIIKDQQKIKIEVEEANDKILPVSKSRTKKSRNQDVFISYIDSAKFHQKKDAKRSIGYVAKALESVSGLSTTNLQNSMAFETLADIYMHWKQYDLAVDNYKRSQSAISNSNIQIKLADAFRMNKKYQESIALFNDLLNEPLSNYQKVEVYEGLGDNFFAVNDEMKSIYNYQNGLDIANSHAIIPKITNLNSKIALAYAQGGANEEAETYFDNSLNLASQENKKRAVSEKNTVADFYNQNNDYEKEIQLREETLNEIESMDDDSEEEDLESPLTPQRQNYKIANAFVAQEKYEEAIPYLKKSIEEADKKEDLVVQKDATRKLSEIYKGIGKFNEAANSYERYVNIVDELYIKKEQEISQAARFSREIALKQNRITSLESERELNESRYNLAEENKELTLKNSRVQWWIIGSLIVIALLLLITAFVQFRSVKQQKYANNLLALKSLRTQMNPHFIFNALNSVNSFIATNDERAANKYLSEFSQLMRSVLENSEEDFIPLTKEIELLEIYVKLEHFRFKDKFDYTITVDEKLKLSEFVIPPMLLQPYVENAVWHGLRYKEEKGNLTINFEHLDTESIRISISDDGIGRKKSKELKTEHQKKQNSKGMGNIKKRINILNEMYKDKVDVQISNVSENNEGTRVQLILKKD
ncbi:MAG: two-component system LytT family sensor kinase [Flavobacteriaceae bacterium]|jgi:two-component system LytT family sensor kinase|uniref:tetratricopeptide repeat-containing sensor histidine kinase n=1 Tax=Candidatus Marifrigoribacter sp. Uisw_064 TaxID=3230970 RepID=UPI003AD96048